MSGRRVKWKCSLGHKWVAVLWSRSNGKGCPVCANKKVQVGFNDLATTHPEIAVQADGSNPTTIIAGSKKKLSWKCELGHQWKAQVGDRTRGRGCPSCSHFGFDPNQPSFLYFLDNFDLQMYQLGITNFPDDRLGSHKRRGWEVIGGCTPLSQH